MKNHDVEQAESVIAEDALASVQAGTSLRPIYEVYTRAIRQMSAPRVTTSNGPLFGADFDYPTRDFEDPR